MLKTLKICLNPLSTRERKTKFITPTSLTVEASYRLDDLMIKSLKIQVVHLLWTKISVRSIHLYHQNH